jgi:hypothetical protein
LIDVHVGVEITASPIGVCATHLPSHSSVEIDMLVVVRDLKLKKIDVGDVL